MDNNGFRTGFVWINFGGSTTLRWYYWEVSAEVSEGVKTVLELQDSGDRQGDHPVAGMLHGLRAAALALRGHVDKTVYSLPEQPWTARGLAQLLRQEDVRSPWQDAVQAMDEAGSWEINVIEPGLIERHFK